MTDRLHRIFTATLVIGVSGAGKTSLLKTFAEYLWEQHRRILLLYSWDGGAIPTQVQKLMRQGLVRFWRARTRSAPGLSIETLYLASRGYWPAEINAETGETSPAVRLVPPVTVAYELTCEHGHPLGVAHSVAAIRPEFCGVCKTLIDMPGLRVEEHATRTPGFEQVGGVGFDSLTSMTTVVMDEMDRQRGQGLIGGEKPAFGGVVESGSIKLGGNNRADVGFGQTRAQQFVANSLSIPYLVEGPVFTALSLETTDDTGLSIVGAKLPGRAATDEASSWFGNVFETGRTRDDLGKEHFTLYLRPFIDAQGRRHLLKNSGSPGYLPEFLQDPAVGEGLPFAAANLGSVFRALDEDLDEALKDAIIEGPDKAPTSYGAPAPPSKAAPPPQGGQLPLTSPTAGPLVGGGVPAPAIPTPRRRPRAAAVSSPAPMPVTNGSAAVPPPPGKPPARLDS